MKVNKQSTSTHKTSLVVSFIKEYMDEEDSTLLYEPLIESFLKEDKLPRYLKDGYEHLENMKVETYGCVYVITDESGRAKVGATSSTPFSRLSALQTGNAEELKVDNVFWAHNFWKMESFLHHVNDFSHVRGEWYWVSSEELSEQLKKHGFKFHDQNHTIQVLESYIQRIKEYKVDVLKKRGIVSELDRQKPVSLKEMIETLRGGD